MLKFLWGEHAMTRNVVRHWTRRLGLVGGTALATLGCPDNATEIIEVASRPSFDFPVTSVFVAPAGTGSVDQVVLADIDLTVPDALARAGSFVVDPPSFFGCGGPCATWEVPIVNGSQDTRLPALQDNDAAGQIGVTLDSQLGVPFAVYLFTGLNPNTLYTFTLERLAVTVNGDLDQPNALLNDPSFGSLQRTPDAPDELVRLGGAPGTSLGDNYYTIGTDMTDGSGALAFNFIPFTGTGNDDILETNANAGFDLPQYNYVVIYEGDPAAGVPVMRAQFGVDLDSNGAPVNNAFAPFPLAALTTGQVLSAPGGAGRPDSISATFSNLEELQGGFVYEPWLVNPVTGASAPVSATYNLIRIVAERDPVTGEVVSTTDQLESSTADVTNFVGGDGGDGFRHQLIVSDAMLAGGAEDTIGLNTDLVLTITDSPGGAMSDMRPFWFSYTDQNGTPDNLFDDSFTFSGSPTFGDFGAGTRRVFSGEGGGLGGFRARTLSIDLQSLSRPPVGYVYVGWLVREDGFAVELPDIRGPAPEFVDLTNADAELVAGVVTPNGILDANFLADREDLGIAFRNFPSFLLTLEPKAGDAAISRVIVQQGAVPDRVLNP